MNVLHFYGVCWQIAIFLDWSLVEGDEQQNGCPSHWDPNPCTCTEQEPSAVTIFCSKISSTEELQHVFASLDVSINFTNFIARNAQFKKLTSDIFGLAKFVTFEFIETELETVENNSFRGSENTVTGIAFLKNNIVNFDFACLKQLKVLGMFTMSSESIVSIPEKAFSHLPKLAVINFVQNPISTIGEFAFSYLPMIRNLIITKNSRPIEKIEARAFYNPGALYFKRLVLADNNITDDTLSDQCFVGVNVTYLDLQQNSLTTLREEVFEPLLMTMAEKDNAVIMGHENPIQCDSKLKWLIDKPVKKKTILTGFECENKQYVTELTEDNLKID